MTKDSVCTAMFEAGIKSPDWVQIAKSLNLDLVSMPAAFFKQWSALAQRCHFSWMALSRAMEKVQDQKYRQAAIKVQQMKGMYSVQQCCLQERQWEPSAVSRI